MKIDFDKVLQRADIQHLRSFLLFGKESDLISMEPYIERIRQKHKPMLAMIEKKFPDMEDNEPLNQKFYEALGAYTNVFMELGLQAGIRLCTQILGEQAKGE